MDGMDRLDAAANRLAELRQAVQTVPELEADLIPQSIADAYDVQDRLIARFDQPIGGWKVGATAVAIQEKLGVSEPFAGPMFAPAIYTSPATLDSARYTHTLIESEFAFRAAKALPPQPGAPYSHDMLREAFDAVAPAIEIIAPCFTPAIGGEVTTRVADFGVSAGLVFGAPVTDWASHDLSAQTVKLMVDGDQVAEGTGALVLGNPLHSLAWLMEHLSARGRTLEAGQMVTTGTTTGLYDLALGKTATADFGPLGAVSVNFNG